MKSKKTASKEFNPKIIAFLCNWCSYAGADLAGVSRLQMPPSFRIIRVMCSSRIDSLFIIRAFLGGADGVIVAGCHPGDCHYRTGNIKAMRRFKLLEKMLGQFGIDKRRMKLDWVAAGEAERFREVANNMAKTIKEIGPLQIKGFVESEVA